jgi:hypothetical protein
MEAVGFWAMRSGKRASAAAIAALLNRNLLVVSSQQQGSIKMSDKVENKVKDP